MHKILEREGVPLPQPGLSLQEPPRQSNWTAAVPFHLIGKRQAAQPSSLLTDPHEDHACGHVQTPHRPGDPAVHLGTLSLATEQGHQADPPGPRGARSQDKALNPHPIAQPRTLAPLKGVSSSPSFPVLFWFLVLFRVLPHTHTHTKVRPYPRESRGTILCESYQSSTTFSSRLMKGAHR